MAIDGLSKTFASGFTALYDFNIVVKKSEIFGLLGPNGAGKSTTFNILTFKDNRSAGEVLVLGSELGSSELDNKFVKMGICPQNNMLFDFLSVQEHF